MILERDVVVLEANVSILNTFTIIWVKDLLNNAASLWGGPFVTIGKIKIKLISVVLGIEKNIVE